MSDAHAGNKIFFAEGESLRKISSEQGKILRIAPIHADTDRQHRSETHNVVSPEHSFDFGQVGFVEVSAVARRLEINPADLNIESIFLRSHDQVRAVGAQFAADLVANVGSHGDHGGGHAHAQSDRYASQQLAPFLPPERFVDQASEHGLLLEHAAPGRDVRFLNDDGIGGDLRL